MRDIATAQLSGNLTRDVDLRGLPSGAEVANLRVASTTRRRAGEEWVDKTNYFTVEVFGAQARSCAEYLRKGSRVFVDAELDWHEWTDQQEVQRRQRPHPARIPRPARPPNRPPHRRERLDPARNIQALAWWARSPALSA
jgi:single stranded DNA-binding protein